MADLLGLDPARIERLRSPERLEHFDPERVWDVVEPVDRGAIVDVGVGVGFLALPFARRFPAATVYGCDVLEGMLDLLGVAADEEGLDNVRCVHMSPTAVPLPDACARLVIMGQVHHELDDPQGLLVDCHRLVEPGGTLAIIDWKDEENAKSPPAGRRVPEGVIRGQLEGAGFTDIASHDVYRYHAFITARR